MAPMLTCPGPMRCLHLWTIYEGARDFPGTLVARMHHCVAGQTWPDAKEVRVAPTLAALRRALPPGLTMMPRQPDDEPQIVEVWI